MSLRLISHPCTSSFTPAPHLSPLPLTSHPCPSPLTPAPHLCYSTRNMVWPGLAPPSLPACPPSYLPGSLATCATHSGVPTTTCTRCR